MAVADNLGGTIVAELTEEEKKKLLADRMALPEGSLDVEDNEEGG